MRVYSCEPTLEAMLTCIYEAWTSRLGYKNIKLMVEPLTQQELFVEHIHVEADGNKAEKLANACITQISLKFYNDLIYSLMGYEDWRLDNVYHVMLLGFHFGANVLERVQYRDVMLNNQMRTRIGKEMLKFIDFMRFHEVPGGTLVAHFEPKSRIIQGLAPHFADRMPSENWMIVDDVHREAAIHNDKGELFYYHLNEEELNRLLKTEEFNDEYTELWKIFHRSVAIKHRENSDLQRNLFPLWTRTHAVEFY